MNWFGNLYKIMTWGESHGKAVGVVIDGCPAGLDLAEDEISLFLANNDRPLPEVATGRCEPNRVVILSGLFEGKTIGTPLSVMVQNEDYKKKDYDCLEGAFRPGHGDFGYHVKYNMPLLSGGGRASGRECISRLIAGFIAEKIILNTYPAYKVRSRITSLAGIAVTGDKDLQEAVKKCKEVASEGDSSGGTVEIIISGLPAGLGEPVFHGLDAMLGGAFLSIGAVKSVEIGKGKSAAFMYGSEFNDDYCCTGDKVGPATNHCGGTQGGISIGNDIVVKLAVKPTPSIEKVKKGLGADKKVREVSVKGRHDKNITPRIAPIARSMAALVVVDNLLLTGRIRREVI